MLKAHQKLFLMTIAAFMLAAFFFWQAVSGISQAFNQSQSFTPPPVAQNLTASPDPLPVLTAGISARVTRVIDGDTFEVNLDGKLQKIRYIGINTPETVDPHRPVQCFGKEASDEDKHLLEGQIVSLEKDISETDKFGRLLRYVYLKLPDNSILFVNDYLVRAGFAQVMTLPPDVKYVNRFLEAQQQARSQKLGLWGRCRTSD